MTKLEQRITALLAKADSTDSPEESQAFYAKAEELMLRHAIDRDALERAAGLDQQDRVVRVGVPFAPPHVRRNWKALGMFGTDAIVRAVGLTTMAVSTRAKLVNLYGREEDCEHVRRLLQAVWRQAELHLARWRKVSAPYLWAKKIGWTSEMNHELDSYLIGFCRGAAAKITEARTSFTASVPGSELVIAGLREEIEKKVADLPNSRAKIKGVSSAALVAGYASGYRASLAEEVTR